MFIGLLTFDGKFLVFGESGKHLRVHCSWWCLANSLMLSLYEVATSCDKTSAIIYNTTNTIVCSHGDELVIWCISIKYTEFSCSGAIAVSYQMSNLPTL